MQHHTLSNCRYAAFARLGNSAPREIANHDVVEGDKTLAVGEWKKG